MTTSGKNAALSVLGRLRAAGHEAYFAGGAVRDLLLGASPHDYDVATSARPEEVTGLFPGAVEVGAHFGVVLVRVGETTVEVATFRSDGAYDDGRHPSEVRFASAGEDVERRDFTVNGLLLDPESEQVIDLVGGRADLEAGLIRAIGEPRARFSEDHLRLLRALRFAAHLGFRIEETTWAAICALAHEAARVSGERVRDELLKMLCGPRPRLALELLHSSGLLSVLLPEVAALDGVEQPPDHHPEGHALLHTGLVLERLELDPGAPAWRREALCLAALLHDVGKAVTQKVEDGPGGKRIRFPGHPESGAAMAGEIARRLRLSRAQTELLVALVAEHDQILQVPRMRRSTRLRFLRRPHIAELLRLHRADRLASSGDLSLWEACRSELAGLAEETLRPPRLLPGDALIALGVPRGPAVGRALEALEDAQLEGLVRSREEAEAWLRAWIEREGEAQ
ncbi:MAG: CCA tRNA nucleotidyltransferase [Polyangia bacterium]|nr:CCA tRNA nucleotidyltransferase [Polyangia bacterium]